MDSDIQRHIRHNFLVNFLDNSIFGFGGGFASAVTILPLFISTMTDSTVLIGLIASIQTIGWQLPQLFTAAQVARLRRYKPMVMFASFHQRWPFFGLALVAWFSAQLGSQLALVLAFGLLIAQSLGGGFTATAWQSMTSKIMPPHRRGTFWGTLSAGSNLMAIPGAVLAGSLLSSLETPLDFTICFVLAGTFTLISWGFLSLTREPEGEPNDSEMIKGLAWATMAAILKRDRGFRWFLIARSLAQIARTAIPFYTVYALRNFNMDEQTAGFLAAVMTLAHMAVSPLFGWVGDRWGHRVVLMAGGLAMAGGTMLALLAPELSWFYIVFALAGLFNSVMYVTTMAMTVDFGSESERPLYFGLSNTIVGVVSLIAPLVGGGLADAFGFTPTFLLATISGLLMVVALQWAIPQSA